MLRKDVAFEARSDGEQSTNRVLKVEGHWGLCTAFPEAAAFRVSRGQFGARTRMVHDPPKFLQLDNNSIKIRSTARKPTTMAPSILKKRKHDDNHSAPASKKVRKHQHYSSPSSSSADEAQHDDEFPAINLADSDYDTDPASETSSTHTSAPTLSKPEAEDEDEESSSSSTDSSTSHPTNPNKTRLSKRHDPTAFASSITAILRTKLPTSKRTDPVLARSATAAEATASIANTKLETKARSKLREDRKEALEKGRVRDVLLGADAGQSVEEMREEEKRLRRTAQKGVVKLFNAVRQAQVRGEEAARKGGTRGRREERVGEMSKKGFLELIAAGGAAPKAVAQADIQEA